MCGLPFSEKRLHNKVEGGKRVILIPAGSSWRTFFQAQTQYGVKPFHVDHEYVPRRKGYYSLPLILNKLGPETQNTSHKYSGATSEIRIRSNISFTIPCVTSKPPRGIHPQCPPPFLRVSTEGRLPVRR